MKQFTQPLQADVLDGAGLLSGDESAPRWPSIIVAAGMIDAEYAAGRQAGGLHGVPVPCNAFRDAVLHGLHDVSPCQCIRKTDSKRCFPHRAAICEEEQPLAAVLITVDEVCF